MNKAALLTAALLAAGWCTMARAQDTSRVRLDEFALPAQTGGTSIEQLGAARAQPLPATVPVPERGVSVPGVPGASRGSLPQISQPEGQSVQTQVGDRAQSRQLATRPVSAPGDSRPQGVVRLGGEDRCDPQQPQDQLAECERILERRASEFQAAEAPRLSAEQALLAAQGERGMSLSQNALPRLARSAAGTPDAESRDNQELAAIVLATRDGATTQAQAPAADLPPDPIAQILSGLGITFIPGQPN